MTLDRRDALESLHRKAAEMRLPPDLVCTAEPLLSAFLRDVASKVRADTFFLWRWLVGGALDTLVELIESLCRGEDNGVE